MASKECYYLREFKNGDYMLWSVCSQSYNNFKVQIKDDRKVYMEVKKTSHSMNLQKLTQDACFYEGGNNLRIEIEFDDPNTDIKESIVTGGVTDRRSNTVGYTYTYCIEDSTDDDYNDAYISVIAWRKKG